MRLKFLRVCCASAACRKPPLRAVLGSGLIFLFGVLVSGCGDGVQYGKSSNSLKSADGKKKGSTKDDAKDEANFEAASQPKNVSGSYLVGSCDEISSDNASVALPPADMYAIDCSFKSSSGRFIEGEVSAAKVELAMENGQKIEPVTKWYTAQGSKVARLMVLLDPAQLTEIKELSVQNLSFSDNGERLRTDGIPMSFSEALNDKISGKEDSNSSGNETPSIKVILTAIVTQIGPAGGAPDSSTQLDLCENKPEEGMPQGLGNCKEDKD